MHLGEERTHIVREALARYCVESYYAPPDWFDFPRLPRS